MQTESDLVLGRLGKRRREQWGWLKSAADCQGGPRRDGMGPGVLRCAAHAAHCFVGIRTRAGVCANAALHCSIESMHGGRRSRARARGACVKRVQPHTILRKTPRGLRFKQNRIETSIQNRNHHQHHSDLTVIDHTQRKQVEGSASLSAFCCFSGHMSRKCAL